MKTRTHALLLAAAAFGTTLPAFADTTIASNVTGRQTVSSGTATVNAGVTVTSSNSDEAMRFTGNHTGLVNYGTIVNTSTGRGLRVNNAAAANVTIVNGADGIIRSAAQDAVQVSETAFATNIGLTNSGLIEVTGTGGQAIDWNGITAGSNTLTNHVGGIIRSNGADAVRTGVNGVVNNAGTITASLVIVAADPDPAKIGSADGSDGIDAQLNAGAVITNTGTIQGRHGITGGPESAPVNGNVARITVTNGSATATPTENATAIVSGLNGSGINIDGVYATALTVVTNYGKITGKWDGVSINGDGDGVDVDGVVHLDNYGTIEALSASGVGSDGRTNTADGVSGGGGIVNNKTGALIRSAQRGILVDDSSGGAGVASLRLTNDGKIQADAGGAVVVVGTLANTIVNTATGIIVGGGTVLSNTGNKIRAAIALDAGDDTLDTAGTITANAGYAAVDLGGGNNTMIVRGGVITGAVSGGTGNSTLTFAPGASGHFAFGDTLARFKSVSIASGTVALTAGASIEWVFSGNALASRGVDFGRIDVTGGASLLVASGTLLKIVNLAAIDYSDAAWATDRSFLVLDATGGSLDGDFALDVAQAGDTAGRGSWSLETGGSQVVAKWTATPVPEPSVYALSATGLVSATAVLRRRRRPAATTV